MLNAVVLPFGQTNVPPLNVKFFVPLAVVKLDPADNVCPFKSTVPLVNVQVLVDPSVKAS